MEQVTPAYLFEQLGRLYVSSQVLRDERDQARAQAQRFARMLEHHVSPDGEDEEVTPSASS